jgi:hypothetical protein
MSMSSQYQAANIYPWKATRAPTVFKVEERKISPGATCCAIVIEEGHMIYVFSCVLISRM